VRLPSWEIAIMLSLRPMPAVLRKGAWFCGVGYEARAAFGRPNKRRTIIAHAGLPGARAEHKEFDSLAVSQTSFLSKETSSMPQPGTTTARAFVGDTTIMRTKDDADPS
jgi:hypothetical protein